MEQMRYANLPIVGRVQHGERVDNGKGTIRTKELGYFIAKIQDDFMQMYLDKFNELFKGKKSLEIEFFNESPLSMKYARYNQSGEVCYCSVNSNMARQKVKNGWQEIECNSNCQYRQKNEQGKQACNRIGWLKFLMPSICKDRIWLMKITSQTSLDRLNEYFMLQKSQGNTIKGRYILFLKQEEHCNCLGQIFNNYVLDILKKDSFNSKKEIPQTIQKSSELSTANVKNVNNNVTEMSEMPTKSQLNIQKEKIEKKETKKKKTKKVENVELIENPNMEKCYVLIGTHTENILKDGKPKEYLIGEFHDMNDNPIEAIIKPEFINNLSESDLGTIVEIDIQEFNKRKIAIDIKYVQRVLKNIAA